MIVIAPLLHPSLFVHIDTKTVTNADNILTLTESRWPVYHREES